MFLMIKESQILIIPFIFSANYKATQPFEAKQEHPTPLEDQAKEKRCYYIAKFRDCDDTSPCN